MKLSKYILSALLLFCAFPALAGVATVNLRIDGRAGGRAGVVILDREYPIVLDRVGAGSVRIELEGNTFAQLVYGKISANIYLQPEADLCLTLDPADWRGDRMAVRGDDDGINTYLREHSALCFKAATTGCDFDLTEDEFMEAVASTIDELYRITDAVVVPDDVKRMLKASARFEVLDWIYKYPRFHRYGERLTKEEYASFARFHEFIYDSYEENAEYLNLSSYRAFMSQWVYELMQLRRYGEAFILKKEDACRWIMENTKDPMMREYMLSTAVYPYIKSEGCADAESIIACFRENVKAPLYTVPFEAECARWERVMYGRKAPDFDYPDVDGKRVRLSDFAGRNVFIDIWATWCAPCCYEIPFVHALAQKYPDIVFVSLSMDKDVEVWRNKVTDDKMGGVQVNFEDNSDFTNWFNISAIPRFIVIDRNGNVVDAAAPKPSSGELEKIFDSLE